MCDVFFFFFFFFFFLSNCFTSYFQPITFFMATQPVFKQMTQKITFLFHSSFQAPFLQRLIRSAYLKGTSRSYFLYFCQKFAKIMVVSKTENEEWGIANDEWGMGNGKMKMGN